MSSTFVTLIVCESVLREVTGIVSAMRIVDIITTARPSAHFYTLTLLHTTSVDVIEHSLQIKLMGIQNDQWVQVAQAPEHRFAYSYQVDRYAPGAFALTTEFELDLAPLHLPETYYVQAWLDGELLAQTTLRLRRG
jgi:hypothetical protein